MRLRARWRLFAASILGSILSAACAASAANGAPRVVASIQPVHSLVAAVMMGVGEPDLLIRGTASEHAYALRPSDMRRLEAADILFWVGEDLEAALRKPLQTRSRPARVVALADEPGIALLENRKGGAWGPHDHDHSPRSPATVGHEHGRQDMHIWLDPDNARRIVEVVVRVLSEADGANAARYRDNGRAATARLAALDDDLRQVLAPVRGRPFIVFHDAYRYFEAHYGLNAVGSMMLSPERAPGARRLQEIRDRIVETRARCVFSEPQYDAALVRTVVSGTPARSAPLDPLGADIEPGPDAYFTLLRRMAEALKTCLGPA